MQLDSTGSPQVARAALVPLVPVVPRAVAKPESCGRRSRACVVVRSDTTPSRHDGQRLLYGLITRSVLSLLINFSVLSPPSASTWMYVGFDSPPITSPAPL